MVKVVQIVVGSVGQKTAGFAVERDGIEIVAAVDPALELRLSCCRNIIFLRRSAYQVCF